MSDLVLDSLRIRSFRAFRDLQIGHLSRVNLIAGKNNVGKSSVLEALLLYARHGSPEAVWRVLRNRGQVDVPVHIGPEEGARVLEEFCYLDAEAPQARHLIAWVRRLFQLDASPVDS